MSGHALALKRDGRDPFRGRTEFPRMSVACTLVWPQGRACHLWMLSKPLPTRVTTASLALGEIISPGEFRLPRKLRIDFPSSKLDRRGDWGFAGAVSG